MNTNFEKNCSAYKFNVEIAEKVSFLCKPLFDRFSINFFSHIKIFKNGKMLRLSTNKDWTYHFFFNEYYNDAEIFGMKNVSINERYLSILSGIPIGNKKNLRNSVFDYGIWNCLLIYERFEDFTEYWCFGTSPENEEILDIYINDIKLFYHFNMYFKDKAKDLLHTKNEDILIQSDVNVVNSLSQENKKYINAFIKDTTLKRYYPKETVSNLYFSKREAECLHYLTSGRSLKEIAFIMQVSTRTVESYINNVKLKSGLTNTSSIIKAFPELSLIVNNQINNVFYANDYKSC